MRFFPFLFCCSLLFIASCNRTEKNTSEINLHVPPDLEATLWAESPMLNNPTNMDVDAKGRIWITEAVNYRSFNNNDSFFLHRQKGDRIMILEDTDNDGKADRSKVFVQDSDLLSPVGIAVLGNKVVVSCSPNLIVYTDTNYDDKPDKKEILLTGFGGKDHDHSLHAVYGGPDGKWYFNAGNAGPHIVTDKNGWTLRSGSMYTGGSPYNEKNEGSQVSDDHKIWTGGLALRVDHDGKNLKVLAHNFRNSYEVIPDSYGNLWQNDNDDEVLSCRTSWIMEGGNAGYFSADGTRNWKADQRPGQEIPVAHWHQDDPGVMPRGDITGAGAPTGITMIEGDELGEQYRGSLLSADAGRNLVFEYKPNVVGSGYALGNRKIFISSVDSDNENYIWNDSTLKSQKEKWFRPSDITIGTDGAIYVADWYDPVVGGHLMQDSAGIGRIYRISRKDKKMERPEINLDNTEGLLMALKSPAINVRYSGIERLIAQGEKVIEPVRQLLNDKNPFIQARAIWLMAQLGTAGRNEVEKILSHNDALIRATAYRAIRQSVFDIIPYAKKMVNDPSPFVRREVAVSIADLSYENKKPLLLQLADSCRDKWMLETIGKAFEHHEPEVYAEIKRRLGAGKTAVNWTDQMAMFAWRLHPAESINDLSLRANATSLSIKDRVAALTALGFIKDKRALEPVRKLATSNSPEIAAAAKFWLQFKMPGYTNNDTGALEKMIAGYKNNRTDKTYNIRDIVKLRPDQRKGEQVFSSYCRTCHKAGKEGNSIGPDLTFISQKLGDEQLLDAIIHPDASVAFGYEPWTVKTKNNKTFYGFLLSDNSSSMMLRDLSGNNHQFKKSEIASAQKEEKSPMPSASQMGLSEQDLANITGYLKTMGRTN